MKTIPGTSAISGGILQNSRFQVPVPVLYILCKPGLANDMYPHTTSQNQMYVPGSGTIPGYPRTLDRGPGSMPAIHTIHIVCCCDDDDYAYIIMYLVYYVRVLWGGTR